MSANFDNLHNMLSELYSFSEIWDKMAEIMQIIIHYGDQVHTLDDGSW